MAKGHRWASWFFGRKPEGYLRLGSAVYLLMHIAETANYESGRFDYNQSRAARELGLSRTTVVAQHDHLERLGWLVGAHRGRYGVAGRLGHWSEYLEWRFAQASEEQSPPPEMSEKATTGPPEMSKNTTADDEKDDNSAPSCHESCQETQHKHVDHELLAPGAGKERAVVKLWQDHYGQPLTEAVLRKLAFLETHYPADWIAQAFAEASDNGAHGVRYVQRILERWSEAGGPEASAKASEARRAPAAAGRSPVEPKGAAGLRAVAAKMGVRLDR